MEVTRRDLFKFTGLAAALVVCDALAAEGAEFFFNSPAVQLHKEGERVDGGGALTRLELPFLNLDIHGKRFMNEVLSFAYLNNLMRGYLEEYDFENPMAAKFFTIMPANWV